MPGLDLNLGAGLGSSSGGGGGTPARTASVVLAEIETALTGNIYSEIFDIDGVLYQERSSPTTLATQDGDRVGYWVGELGNFDLTVHGTDANRGTLRIDADGNRSIEILDGEWIGETTTSIHGTGAPDMAVRAAFEIGSTPNSGLAAFIHNGTTKHAGAWQNGAPTTAFSNNAGTPEWLINWATPPSPAQRNEYHDTLVFNPKSVLVLNDVEVGTNDWAEIQVFAYPASNFDAAGKVRTIIFAAQSLVDSTVDDLFYEYYDLAGQFTSAQPFIIPNTQVQVDAERSSIGSTGSGTVIGHAQYLHDISTNNNHGTMSETDSTQIIRGSSMNDRGAFTFRGDTAEGLLPMGWTPVTDFWGSMVVQPWDQIDTGGDDERPLVGAGVFSIGMMPDNGTNSGLRVTDGTTTWDTANGTFERGAQHIVSWQFQGGTSLEVWVDGVKLLNITSGVASPTLGELNIGGATGGTNRFGKFDMGAGVFGSGVRSDANRLVAEANYAGWQGSATVEMIVDWSSFSQDLNTRAAQGVVDITGASRKVTTGAVSQQQMTLWDDQTPVFTLEMAALGAASHAQVNHMAYDGTDIWAGANNHNTTPAYGSIFQIGVDTVLDELNYVDEHVVRAAWCEGPAIDSAGDFLICYHDVNILDRYRMVGGTWTFIKEYTIPGELAGTTVGLWQGPMFVKDLLYMQWHGGNGLYPRLACFRFTANDELVSVCPSIRLPTTSLGQGFNPENDNLIDFAQRVGAQAAGNHHTISAVPEYETVSR